MPALITTLRHYHPHVRGQSIFTLKRLGPTAASARKIAKDKKEHQSLRDGAKHALKSLNG